MRSYGGGGRSRTAHRRPGGARRGRPAVGLPLDERAVLADEQLEVLPLLVGELEEDLLALGILEPLAVALEELVRAALAADANHERLLVVHAIRQQLLCAFGEQAVCGALEEEERRARFELRIARQQHGVPRLQRGQVFLLFAGQLREHAPAAGIARDRGGAGVELEAAALGGDRDAERIAREEQLGRTPVDGGALPARPARLALAVDLDDALPRGEAARG